MARGNTVLIASHQTHYFKDCDRVITMEDGVIVKDKLQGQSRPETSTTVSVAPSTTVHSKTESTQQAQKPSGDVGKLTTEEKLTGQGNISWKTYKMYFGAGSKAFLILQLTLLVIFEAIK